MMVHTTGGHREAALLCPILRLSLATSLQTFLTLEHTECVRGSPGVNYRDHYPTKGHRATSIVSVPMFKPCSIAGQAKRWGLE